MKKNNFFCFFVFLFFCFFFYLNIFLFSFYNILVFSSSVVLECIRTKSEWSVAESKIVFNAVHSSPAVSAATAA